MSARRSTCVPETFRGLFTSTMEASHGVLVKECHLEEAILSLFTHRNEEDVLRTYDPILLVRVRIDWKFTMSTRLDRESLPSRASPRTPADRLSDRHTGAVSHREQWVQTIPVDCPATSFVDSVSCRVCRESFAMRMEATTPNSTISLCTSLPEFASH